MLEFKIEMNNDTIKGFDAMMSKAGAKGLKVLEEVLEAGADMIKNHAQANHYFVGVGIGSQAKAEEHVFTFVNPDGSPRFKIRTGNLRRSIQTSGIKHTMDGVEAQISTGMEYARDVEEGGPGRRAFPFMKPAFEASRPQILRMAKNGLKSITRG